MEKQTIAIMYDFDKTLCTKDMQEYSFISEVGMSATEFWGDVTKLAQSSGMDRILAYLYDMLKQAKRNDVSIRRETFVKSGENIELFPGVIDWFKRINDYGDKLGLKVEHYIISSGMKELIEGIPIANEFKKIYACEFHYDVNGVADWPTLVVNYTNKTQFLFRVNKGVLEVSEDEKLNEFVEDINRPVPFRNMIYIGDGLTDVPCMKLTKVNGGQSIAVYTDNKKIAENLLRDRRVDFIVPADYTQGSEMEQLMQTILDKMMIVNKLVEKNHNQRGVGE